MIIKSMLTSALLVPVRIIYPTGNATSVPPNTQDPAIDVKYFRLLRFFASQSTCVGIGASGT